MAVGKQSRQLIAHLARKGYNDTEISEIYEVALANHCFHHMRWKMAVEIWETDKEAKRES